MLYSFPNLAYETIQLQYAIATLPRSCTDNLLETLFDSDDLVELINLSFKIGSPWAALEAAGYPIDNPTTIWPWFISLGFGPAYMETLPTGATFIKQTLECSIGFNCLHCGCLQKLSFKAEPETLYKQILKTECIHCHKNGWPWPIENDHDLVFVPAIYNAPEEQ